MALLGGYVYVIVFGDMELDVQAMYQNGFMGEVWAYM